jgi:hypothetical protein
VKPQTQDDGQLRAPRLDQVGPLSRAEHVIALLHAAFGFDHDASECGQHVEPLDRGVCHRHEVPEVECCAVGAGALADGDGAVDLILVHGQIDGAQARRRNQTEHGGQRQAVECAHEK